MLLKRNLTTLELQHVEINISSSAKNCSVNKNQNDYSYFDLRWEMGGGGGIGGLGIDRAIRKLSGDVPKQSF